jgi:hypothetical protein
LVDLLRAVRAGIAGIWDQRGNGTPFNFICWPFWLQNMFSYGLARSRRKTQHNARSFKVR